MKGVTTFYLPASLFPAAYAHVLPFPPDHLCADGTDEQTDSLLHFLFCRCLSLLLSTSSHILQSIDPFTNNQANENRECY